MTRPLLVKKCKFFQLMNLKPAVRVHPLEGRKPLRLMNLILVLSLYLGYSHSQTDISEN
jgi:hypothetical protein